jgi:pyruvate-formate lyase-activating enzyme
MKTLLLIDQSDIPESIIRNDLPQGYLLERSYRLTRQNGDFQLRTAVGEVVKSLPNPLALTDFICRQESADYLLRVKGAGHYAPAPGLLQRLLDETTGGGLPYAAVNNSAFFLYDFIMELVRAAELPRLLPLRNAYLPNGRTNYLQAGIPARVLEPNQGDLQHYLVDNFQRYYPKPRASSLDIVMICNLRCTKCCFHGEQGPRWHRRQKEDEQDIMTPERFYAIVDRVLDYQKGMYFVFSNAGEPTLHSRLVPFVGHVKKRGGRVQITTNGKRLTPDLGKALVDLGVDQFMISFGAATEKTYRANHPGGDFRKTRENVEGLIEEVDRKGMQKQVRVNMHFVREPQNRHEEDEYREYWLPRSGIVSIHQLNSLSSEYAHFEEKFYMPENRFPCQVLWTSLNIHNNGDFVYCCCWDRSRDEGNIFEESIDRFWTGEKIQEIRQAHVRGQYDIVDQCGRCDAWMALPHELEMSDRYYAEIDPLQKVYYKV